jgi:hypothetical protein
LDLSFFEIFAECSVAFAGFAAVHAALRGSTTPRGVFRAWWVVASGSAAFVLSVLPLLFAYTSLSGVGFWRSVSGLSLPVAGATAYLQLAFDVRMTRIGHPPQAPMAIRSAQALLHVAVVLMIGNLVGWPWAPGPLAYATASVLILGAGLTALLHSFFVPLQIALGADDPEAPR